MSPWVQSYADELLSEISQDEEEAGPSGFIDPKRKYRPPKRTYISSEESFCDETERKRPTKKKERRRSTNTKAFQDTL